MEKTQARRLSDEATDLTNRREQAPESYPREVQVALMRLAMERVPDSATAAVTGRQGGDIYLAAVNTERRALYLLEPVPFNPNAQNQKAKCRVIPIVPGRCTLELESHAYSSFGEHRSAASWSFNIGGVDLRFRTELGLGTHELADDEAFAVALADAAGVPVESPAGSMAAVAAA